MSGKIKQLICLPNDPSSAVGITPETQVHIRNIAKKCKLVLTETDEKIYVGPHDYATPTAPDYKNSETPYESQRDNEEWWRTCFSSSCAMVLQDYKPGILGRGGNRDEVYLRKVNKFGDTTDPEAQRKALAEYGVTAHRAMDGTLADLDRRVDNGEPVAIGILHQGTPDHPRGGGHWIVVVGREGKKYVVNDPYGELDLVRGRYLHADGERKEYSRKNLGKRWMADGDGTGWFMDVTAVDGKKIKR